jgi:hypothetical protein
MPGEDFIKQVQEQFGEEQRELLGRFIADVTAHHSSARAEDLEILTPNEEGRFVLHRDPSPLFKKRGPGVIVKDPKATTYPAGTPIPEKNGEN